MATDDSSLASRLVAAVRGLVGITARLVGDVLIITGWVLLLTLLFLETTWPRWAFYLLLLLGVGLYVSVTLGWTAAAE